MEEYAVAWLLTPWLQSTWCDEECIVSAVLFVSRRARVVFLECMREQGGIAFFPCASVVYELHVHPTPIRQPGVTPVLPMHWRVVVEGCRPSVVACIDMWSRSREGTRRIHEDAWYVMPDLHDGSTCAYDFDMLLRDLELGSLETFYDDNVRPMWGILDRLRMAGRGYRMHTHAAGLRNLFVQSV